MLKTLKVILEIQDLDMQMLRLMKLKKERQQELSNIDFLRQDLKAQQESKEKELQVLALEIQTEEGKILEIKDQLKKLEQRQGSIKKVEEFNALTQEMSTKERERIAAEHKASDLIDKRNMEEEILIKIKDSLVSSEESSKAIETEIKATIKKINEEGREIKERRDAIAKTADSDVLKIYSRLLNNKKDRVVVPLENRACSGCHITLTAQHENLVRKGERLIFCEHCSRILYWQESEDLEGTSIATKKMRRRTSTNL